MTRLNGNTSLVIKLKLTLKDGGEYAFDGKNGRPFTNDVFVSFSATLNGFNNTAWRGELVLMDTTGAAEEALLLIGTGAKFVIDFDYADSAAIHPVYSGSVLKVGYKLRDDGVALILDLCSSATVAGLIISKVITWPIGTPAHQVFQDLAAAYGWVTTDGGKSLVLEQSVGIPVPLTFDSVQGRPERWIVKNLIQYAVTPAPLSRPFMLSVMPPEDGDSAAVFHFHPTDWSPIEQNYDASPIGTYEYRRGDGVVLEADVDDQTLTLAVMGAYNMESSGVDSLNGTSLSTRIEQSGGNVAFSGDGDLAPFPVARSEGLIPDFKKSVGELNKRYHHFASRDDVAYNAKLIHKLAHLVNSVYSMNMSIIGDHGILPHKCFNFVYRTPKSVKHFVSGIYRVGFVSHNVTQQGWVTQVTAYRNSLGDGSPYDTLRVAADRMDDQTANGTTSPSLASPAGTVGKNVQGP